MRKIIMVCILTGTSALAGWVRLPYDTLVPDHIETNNPVIISNIYPSEVYLLELAQGIQERCLATSTTVGTNLTSLQTNIVFAYTNIDSRPYSWYTNLALTNTEGVVTGYTIFTNDYVLQDSNLTEVVTNYIYTSWSFAEDPMSWSIERTTYDDSVRYITSLTTNLITNITTSITNVTTNVTVQSSMGNNTRTYQNGIDNYVNRELYGLINDKWYDLVDNYLNSSMTNDSGNFDGLINDSLPVFSTGYQTETYNFGYGDIAGRSIWEYYGGVYETTSNYPAATYYTNKYMSGTNVITEIVTNPVNLIDYEHGVIQFPIWSQTSSVDVITNAWRYGDETNNGYWIDDAWTNWTENTYIGRFNSYSNWLARHELIKQLKWVERDASLQWPYVTNSSDITTGGSDDITDYLSWWDDIANDKVRFGNDADSDLATAQAQAISEWSGSITTNDENDIRSLALIDGGYYAELDTITAIASYTNDFTANVVLSLWANNQVSLWNSPDFSTEDDNGSGYTNAYPSWERLTSFLILSKAVGSSVELGTTDIPNWPTSPDGTNKFQRGFLLRFWDASFSDVDNATATFIWQPDTAANSYTYYGNSYYSWDEAKTLAERNLLKGEWITNSPTIKIGTAGKYYTNSTIDTPQWEAWIYQQAFEGKVTGLNTNMTKTVDWYLWAQPLTAPLPAEDTSNAYYQVDSGERLYYPTSFWHLVASTNYAADVHTATSPPLGAVSRVASVAHFPTNLPPWVENPNNYVDETPSVWSSRGWQGTTVKAVVKYDFNYCTNNFDF